MRWPARVASSSVPLTEAIWGVVTVTFGSPAQARAEDLGLEHVGLEPGTWLTVDDHRAVPQVVFTDPEIASMGLSEAEAAEAGVSARIVDYALGQVAGAALYADGYPGHVRLVVDEDRRVVVGEVPLDRLWHAVPSYLTISEVWLRLPETYGM